jgi:hypothetical protein
MKQWILIAAALVLSGCATKAYRAVEQECAPAAWADYPVQNAQVIQTRQRVIHVATGMRNCFTRQEGNHMRTICNPITRPEFINYQEVVVVDQNEVVRNMAIATCSTNLCVQRYGNPKCITDQLLVPVPVSSPAPAPNPEPTAVPVLVQ